MKLQLSLRNNKQVKNESAAANDSKHVIKQRMSIMTNEHTKKTFTAQSVDLCVLDGTKAFCKSSSSSLDKKLKRGSLFSLSFRP